MWWFGFYAYILSSLKMLYFNQLTFLLSLDDYLDMFIWLRTIASLNTNTILMFLLSLEQSAVSVSFLLRSFCKLNLFSLIIEETPLFPLIPIVKGLKPRHPPRRSATWLQRLVIFYLMKSWLSRPFNWFNHYNLRLISSIIWNLNIC